MWRADGHDKSELIELLRRLVAIDSVNAGKHAAQIDRPEQQIAEFISQYLSSQLGMQVTEIPLAQGRPNVIGTWSTSGKSLMLTAHMDTVNVDGMTVDPFDMCCRQGRLYGRGTCDTKGSIAVFLYVLKLIRQFGWQFDRKIHFVATAGEENGCYGAKAIGRADFNVDEAIVGEPTGCQVAVAHKAAMRLDLLCLGRSAHACVPHEGINANYLMCDAIRQLQTVAAEKFSKLKHELLGSPSIAVTVINGGARYNIIPDRCRATVDVRPLPEQNRDNVLAILHDAVAEILSDDSFRFENIQSNAGLETSINEPIACRLLEAQRMVTRLAEPTGVQFFADSGPFAQAGTKCVLLGPGHVAQAHAPDEFVEIDQLLTAAQILIEFFSSIKSL